MNGATNRKRYDFYADMLETHSEVGYLLVVLAALAIGDVTTGIMIAAFPAEDVYLVPGTGTFGSADVIWGAPPPVEPTATSDQSSPAATVLRADLGAGERSLSASAAAPSGSASAADAGP